MRIAEILNEERFKYPRTPHLPWSEGATSDDKILTSTDHFNGKQVVITEKMDGENTTLYRDYYHARSIDSRHHPSRTWVKQMHATIANDIPNDWRICGENLYARHSIAYSNLQSYFYVFSIWNEVNNCLSWAETEEWADLLGLHTVPVLYKGIWNEEQVRQNSFRFDHEAEGYVVRLAESFNYSNFSKSIAKYVRKNHVQTDKHWMEVEVVPNKLTKSP